VRMGGRRLVRLKGRMVRQTGEESTHLQGQRARALGHQKVCQVHQVRNRAVKQQDPKEPLVLRAVGTMLVELS